MRMLVAHPVIVFEPLLVAVADTLISVAVVARIVFVEMLLVLASRAAARHHRYARRDRFAARHSLIHPLSRKGETGPSCERRAHDPTTASAPPTMASAAPAASDPTPYQNCCCGDALAATSVSMAAAPTAPKGTA